MEGFQPSFMEVDNMTWDQLGIQSLEDISELLSSPPEVPVNQSSTSCNDQGGQNNVINGNVINNSIQQTTPFPMSFPETMMEGFPPSSMDDDLFGLQSPLLYMTLMEEVDNMTLDQLGFQSEEDTFNMSELLSPPPAPEVPVNQSSISCNDQGGQNNVINDSIQQTTQFPTSFPETMLRTHAYSNLLQCPLN
uniref:Uncharacterized protein n=1 Tax=Populus davidiana TaxID=266767 RepID=A0A6M2EKQ5_9ROSI